MKKRLYATICLVLMLCIARADDFVFTPVNVAQGLSDNQVRYILQLHNGRMVFTTSGNLNLYDGARFHYLHRPHSGGYELKKYDGFYRVYEQGDSLLWIKDTHRLMCVDLRREKFLPDLHLYFKSIGVQKQAEDVFVDAHNRLWLVNGRRLWRQDAPGEWELPEEAGALQDLVADGHRLYLFFSSGKLIAYDLKTTRRLYASAAYADAEKPLFARTSLVVTGKGGFYQLRNGSKGGCFFFDTSKRIWEKKLETDYTLNTLALKEGKAFVSCRSGFWIIEGANGRKNYLPELKTVDGSLINTEISTLFFDRQGGFWLGTLNQGLLYYHPQRYKFSYIGRSYFPVAAGKDIIVQAFAGAKEGSVLIKCNTGVYRFTPLAQGDGRLVSVGSTALPEGNWTQQGVGNGITAVHTDSRGWTWRGTADGLKLQKPGEKEKVLYTEDGLANNFIHAILEDRNHQLWVTTGYGISRIGVDSVTGNVRFENYNVFDGTLTGEYADGAALEARDGTLYFGGINGFTLLKPYDLYAAAAPLQPVLTGLYLRGTQVLTGARYDNRTVLPLAAPYTKQLELSHDQNFLRFEFSALNYLNPSRTRYRYRLAGVDADWQEAYAGAQHEQADGVLRIAYTNLAPGTYVLSVMASVNGGQWNGGVTELKITIHAPWWKTTTAYLLYGIFCLLAVVTAVWWYNYNTRKRMERLHREEILLIRIRNLIEQCNLLEAEKNTLPVHSGTDNIEEGTDMSAADAAFLARAMEIVEKNLEEPGYSVEALSRDLCMERTGLYRKLVALLDKSPSLFIRNIRLQKAAAYILEGKLSIGEIADKTGFSSASYLSRCFQETYGCRPSEYAEKTKKST
ncbi:AraC-like DNA-binding protein [Filimonas zeae]|uniref:Transcriptional regulator n=1 Tax=Filimonas zeae TaxID=1737353 RepID=A0A917IUL4_9BACT|nr:helix-turn-helix domain-containing protein [Filimonas zeae]MDR6339476.1 AraC-like DNA-binding protein [Filimonas zeae]GGH63442.1 transcriptional regulator [Filimonas zeae]